MLKIAAWTEVASVPAAGIPAKHQSLSGFFGCSHADHQGLQAPCDTGTRLPMITEDLSEPIMPSEVPWMVA